MTGMKGQAQNVELKINDKSFYWRKNHEIWMWFQWSVACWSFFPFTRANAPTIIIQTFEVVLSPTFYGVFVCHFGWIAGKACTQLYYNGISCASDTLYILESWIVFLLYKLWHQEKFFFVEMSEEKILCSNFGKQQIASIIWCWNEIFKHVFVFFFSVRQIFHDFYYWPCSRYYTQFFVCLLK